VIDVKFATKKRPRSKDSRKGTVTNKRNITVPTWPEFVQYILKTLPSTDVSC